MILGRFETKGPLQKRQVEREIPATRVNLFVMLVCPFNNIEGTSFYAEGGPIARFPSVIFKVSASNNEFERKCQLH